LFLLLLPSFSLSFLCCLGAFAILRCSCWNRPVSSSVCPYTWDSSRTDKPILIKFDTGEFTRKLSTHFNFHLNRTILTTVPLYKRSQILFELTHLSMIADDINLVCWGGGGILRDDDVIQPDTSV
jgi:hypothetical protein